MGSPKIKGYTLLFGNVDFRVGNYCYVEIICVVFRLTCMSVI